MVCLRAGKGEKSRLIEPTRNCCPVYFDNPDFYSLTTGFSAIAMTKCWNAYRNNSGKHRNGRFVFLFVFLFFRGFFSPRGRNITKILTGRFSVHVGGGMPLVFALVVLECTSSSNKIHCFGYRCQRIYVVLHEMTHLRSRLKNNVSNFLLI